MNSLSKQGKNFNYVLIAPDGGWGYMIVLAFIVYFSFTMGTYVAFGLVFGDFLKERGDMTTATTLVHGVLGITFALMGLLTNRLLSNYSLRAVGIVGSLIYFLGALLSVFVQTIPQLIFTFGLLQGVGSGLMTPVVFTALNQYFVRKRQVIHSISQSGSTGMGLILPTFLQYLVEIYGQRGTAALLAALSLHTLFAMVLIQPVEWHMMKSKLNDSTIKSDTTKIERLSDEEKPVTKKTFRQIIVDTLDLTLLTDLKFANLIFGCALGYVSDICVVNLASIFLLNRGFTAQTTSFILTLYVSGDFLSRIIQIVCSLIFVIKSRYLVLFGMVMAGILRLVFAFCSELTISAIVIIGLGFFRSWLHVPLAPSIAENCTQKRFPAAFGLYMITLCLLNIVLSIIIAITSQIYQNDTLTICILGTLILLGAISWIYEMVLLKYWRAKSYQTQNT